MSRPEDRYMETLDRLLLNYQQAGIPAVGLVPDFLTEAGSLPRPLYSLVFRRNGELYNNFGPESAHYVMLAQVSAKRDKGE